MFNAHFFAPRYFAPRYFPEVGADAAASVRAYATISLSLITTSTITLE